MLNIWLYNITENLKIVSRNEGPDFVTVVSGSEADREYWKEHFLDVRNDLFRKDGTTEIFSVCENTRKGNFLGMLKARMETKQINSSHELSNVGLMSFLFGQGTRLSPFTQAMGNRKPAILTPKKSRLSSSFLTGADISNLYSNTLVKYFRDCGFQGMVMKWGDEAVIPSLIWSANDYTNVDAVRFVWVTEVTETLAREKEWVEFDSRTNSMTFQYPRQDISTIQPRLESSAALGRKASVNLGSFALSYKFMDVAQEIFKKEMEDDSIWIDWDPYVWIALSCPNKAAWEREIEIEERSGLSGIKQLLMKVPSFFEKILAVRENLERLNGRPLSIKILDFGDLLHIDWGLHWSIREILFSLLGNTDKGIASRELFEIPEKRDVNGNIVLNSRIPKAADIRNSLIIDSTILDESSVIHKGVIIGGKHNRVMMPQGGIALFCSAYRMVYDGPNGMAYRSIGHNIMIPEGGRHTTLLTPDGMVHMRSNETVTKYSGSNYDEPILGNPLSFSEAARIMSKIPPKDLEDSFDFWH